MEIFEAIKQSGIITLLRDWGLFAGTIWLVQHLINKSTTKNIEKYKSKLSEETKEFQLKLDFDLENYKEKLNFETFKATRLHERRLNVILELHKKLITLNRNMLEMTAFMKEIHTDNPEQEEVDRIKKAAESYNDFMLYLQENSIFIPESTEKNLDQIRNDYFESYSDYTFGRKFGISDFTYKKSSEAGERVKGKISDAVIKLKSDFRELIGSTN